jgi:hypothetical protein
MKTLKQDCVGKVHYFYKMTTGETQVYLHFWETQAKMGG